MEASSLCTKPCSCCLFFDRNRVFVQPPALIISRELADGRSYGYRENDPKKTGELAADDERENDEERRHAHDARHDEGVNKMIFELLRDDVERYSEEPQWDASSGKGDSRRDSPGKNNPEYRDDFKERRDDRKDQGVRYTQNGEA